jgi:hypothetical protein
VKGFYELGQLPEERGWLPRLRQLLERHINELNSSTACAAIKNMSIADF